MCRIIAISGTELETIDTQKYLQSLHPRGPDAQDCFLDDNVYMGFTRLSINDLSSDGMQPMQNEDKTVSLICNGEIYNHKEIAKRHDFDMKSQSDCEVVLHLYLKYRNSLSFSDFVLELDGEFAFVIYDKSKDLMLACRDRHGVRPLFRGTLTTPTNTTLAFASELKALTFCEDVHQVQPGTYETTCRRSFVNNVMYYSLYFNDRVSKYENQYDTEEIVLESINKYFRKAVEKRLMSERPICCLLSGGLDSSLVSALVASHFPPKTVHTFSIGFEGSPDLYYARKVADHIQSVHHEVIVTEEEFLHHIEETIRVIESYDTTSVRASVGNLLVAKYISNHTDHKVVFNGDYSDEVCGGYKYFKNAPSAADFDLECKRLVTDICYFDSLRSDRTVSSQGLEARVPFSDHDFVSYYFGIPVELRMRPDKYLLRKAFEKDHLLPEEILWRPKEAFSDGVSKKEHSWHTILKNHINSMVSDEEFANHDSTTNKPLLKETYYYQKIFNRYYKKYTDIIPYFWMPKWCDESLLDPSAREIV